jgi:hypothetical protein
MKYKECKIVDENVRTSRMTMAKRSDIQIGTESDPKEKNSLDVQEYMCVHPPMSNITL